MLLTKTEKKRLDKSLREEVQHLKKLCTWLYANRKEFGRCNHEGDPIYFDYPDYLGMPKSLSRLLSSDTVDRIQEHQEDLRKVRTPATVVGWFLDV